MLGNLRWFFIFTIAICRFGFAEDISDEHREFFESKIRPVLAENCYECHNSRDSAEGELALDWRGAVSKGGESGRIIDPANPAGSLLVRVMRHEIEGLEMPDGGAKLAAAIATDFERWIKMGAPDPRDKPPSKDELADATSWEAVRDSRKKWWSFQPIAAVAPPQGPAAHEVDRFVHQRLAAAELSPSKRADRQTLIRRATFALTGLPPTIEQVDSFLGDERDDAFERLVDELIDSPAFGERWARHWMDWVRYAESHGSEGDPRIENAWFYRDYLIRALNADIPYDQLLREHVAGDLLQNPRINDELGINESLIGTAHWRMVFHGFAPTDALDEKVRFTDDQIDTFSKAFLGLTVSCARCHNHKFDAISQADYYALFGILGSTRPGRSAIETPEIQQRNVDRLKHLKVEIRRRIAHQWLDRIDQIAKSIVDSELEWPGADKSESLLHPLHILREAKTESPEDFARVWQEQRKDWKKEKDTQSKRDGYVGYWDLSKTGDAAEWYATGIGISNKPLPPGEFRLASNGDRVIEQILPSGLHSGTLSKKHPARLASTAFYIGENEELWLKVDGGGSAMTRYVIQNYPRNGTVFPVKNLDGKQNGQWRWHRYGLTYWQGDSMHIELSAARDAPLLTRGNDRSWFSIREAVVTRKGQPSPGENRREFMQPLFAKDARVDSLESLAGRYTSALKQVIENWKSGRSTNSEALLLDRAIRDGLLENSLGDLGDARQLVEEYRELEDAIPVARRVPTLAEWKGNDQPLFVRGNHKQPGETVPRRFLEAVDATPYATANSGRLKLADDLLRDDNPLTRRVIVNRIWHYLFGAGLVETVDNLGRLGTKPSHPELLDFLANRFRDEGWSIKKMVRYLVLSDTWQQTSQPTPAAIARDPQNRLWSHASVRRLEAEAIRDSMLAADGRLNRDQFGSPAGGDSDRRSVYVNVIRNRLDPFLQAFDAPVPFGAKGRRNITNVPAQSLLMMNDPFVTRSATELARASERESEDDQERIQTMWRSALGREPGEKEIKSAMSFVAELKQTYENQHGEAMAANRSIDSLRTSIAGLLDPIRARLVAEQSQGKDDPVDLEPLAAWDFEADAKDSIGGMDCTLRDGAQIDDGALILNGSGWASTGKLPKDLKEKTLEATVMLANYKQKGGGVMTLQDMNGNVFDSIVIGEQQERHWLAGSDGFRRTERFNGQPESEAKETAVHLVMTYASDGTTTLYRNGKKYGSFRKGIHRYQGNNSQIIFGMRHGTSKANGRMLRGRILQARLYDRTLNAEEAKAAAAGGPYVSAKDVEAELSPVQKNQLEQWRSDLAAAESKLKSLAKAPDPDQAWIDLAQSIYNLKEFIYVR